MPLGTLDGTPPPFFRQGPSALSKLTFFSALALFLMVADMRFQLAKPVRSAVATVLYPVQWLALRPLLLKAGTASYQDQPGVDPTTYNSRWGDYSATSVDPTDPSIFWTIQAYPSGPAVWSTQITQLLTVPSPPRLTVVPAGTNALVSWPGSAALLQLQSSTNIIPGSFWFPVPQTPVTVGNITSVQVPATASKQFFRLVATP